MIELIPAIDLIDGHCVRLTKGKYDSKKVYDCEPLEIAKEIERLGYRRLHMVDLDGARANHVVNTAVLHDVTKKTGLQVDFGGGIKSDADIEAVFRSGASFAVVGSVAVKQPALMERWIRQYGADKIILGADVSNGYVCISGWEENSDKQLLPFVQSYYDRGVRRVLCTDINRDGMLQGTSIELYSRIMRRFPDLLLIASGGVSCEEDIARLNQAGIPSVVFGKAIYEGKINLAQLADKYCRNH